MSADLGDLIFDTAKAAVEASRVAYAAGYEAGYRAGVDWALIEAHKIIGRPTQPLPVCPTCHGRGASVTNTTTGGTVYYCNCEAS